MNNNRLVLFFIGLIFVWVGVLCGWMLAQKYMNPVPKPAFVFNEKQKDKNIIEDRFLAKEGFRTLLPIGWSETSGLPGISFMAVNSQEENTDPAVQKINFKTYYAVKYDKLAGKSLVEFAKYYKDLIKQSIIGISYEKEGGRKFNDKDGYTLEGLANQQGAEIKFLIVFLKGKGDDVWILSFDTALNNWGKYTDKFENIISSFEIN